MSVDPREYIANDKRMPASISGGQGKILAVTADELAYELITPSGTRLTGEIIMWFFDAPPAGFIKVGATYAYDDYPTLGGLFGAVAGENFDIPAVNFPKGSEGVNTGTVEPADVGTHGHVADEVSNHSHTLNVVSASNHVHSISGGNHNHTFAAGLCGSGGSLSNIWGSGCSRTGNHPVDYGGSHSHTVGSNGAHGHGNSTANSNGGHTPVVQDHTGVNQPECTLVNFCIKT